MKAAEEELAIKRPAADCPPASPPQERIVYRPGDPECAHCWKSTGDVAGGHARFRCRNCGALMSEPVCQTALQFTERVIPPGHALCAVCGRTFEAAALHRAPYGRRRPLCSGCLDTLLNYNNHDEPFFFRLA